MKANMGTADKTVRIILAIVVGVLYYFGIISGTLAIILGIFAVVFIATSFISFCPLYLPFGITTRRKTAK
ncbi:YgaP family membrane protein [Marivirga sp.]|uniref:YgaP family membrane protein n=1 Tax=Marivirga sp. TaxID=2018662 RepID=UPI003DA72366